MRSACSRDIKRPEIQKQAGGRHEVQMPFDQKIYALAQFFCLHRNLVRLIDQRVF
jgi:hypothetical protein